MDASLSLRRESPAAVTHHLPSAALVVMWEADGAALLGSSSSPDGSFLFILWNGEAVLQGQLRPWGWSLLLAGPCHCKLAFSCPPPPFVPLGEFLAV